MHWSQGELDSFMCIHASSRQNNHFRTDTSTDASAFVPWHISPL